MIHPYQVFVLVMDSDVFWFCNIDYNVRIKDFFEGKREGEIRKRSKSKMENLSDVEKSEKET